MYFNKYKYAICAILLGSFGVNSFIAGNIGMGILKILFCWTGIPGIVGLIQGISVLGKSGDEVEQVGIFDFEDENDRHRSWTLVQNRLAETTRQRLISQYWH